MDKWLKQSLSSIHPKGKNALRGGQYISIAELKRTSISTTQVAIPSHTGATLLPTPWTEGDEVSVSTY